MRNDGGTQRCIERGIDVPGDSFASWLITSHNLLRSSRGLVKSDRFSGSRCVCLPLSFFLSLAHSRTIYFSFSRRSRVIFPLSIEDVRLWTDRHAVHMLSSISTIDTPDGK